MWVGGGERGGTLMSTSVAIWVDNIVYSNSDKEVILSLSGWLKDGTIAVQRAKNNSALTDAASFTSSFPTSGIPAANLSAPTSQNCASRQ